MFSPKVERALSYASLRHAGQTRKGRETPYFTHLVHVALMLARAGADDDTLVVALLHDVIEDTARGPEERAQVATDIRTIWGEKVLDAVQTLTEPKRDAEGQPVPWRSRKEAYLQQLEWGSRCAHLVSAADKIHNLETLLQDLEEQGPEVWQRFTGGPGDSRWFYRGVHGILVARLGSHEPLVTTLSETLTRFEARPEVRAAKD